MNHPYWLKYGITSFIFKKMSERAGYRVDGAADHVRSADLLFQALNSSGVPLSGAKLNFYITLTTTRKDTFSDAAKTTPNANPVVADSAGRFADIFMDTDVGYSVVYTDSADVTIDTVDPVGPVLVNPTTKTLVLPKSTAPRS